MVTDINSSNFKSEVLDSTGKVLVDFWAPWCGPCQMLSPVIDEISQENDGIKVVKLNVDESPDIAASLNVTSIPTVLLFENGQVVKSWIGFRQKQEYVAAITG